MDITAIIGGFTLVLISTSIMVLISGVAEEMAELDTKISQLEEKLESAKTEIKNDRRLFEQLLEQLNKKIIFIIETRAERLRRGEYNVVDLTEKEKEIKQKEKELEKLKEYEERD